VWRAGFSGVVCDTATVSAGISGSRDAYKDTAKEVPERILQPVYGVGQQLRHAFHVGFLNTGARIIGSVSLWRIFI
jgi:hypothetical protein